MRTDLIEAEFRRPVAAWIGSLAGAAVMLLAWFGVVLCTQARGIGVWEGITAVAVGAVVGAFLGWLFPRTVKALGSVFLSLLP